MDYSDVGFYETRRFIVQIVQHPLWESRVGKFPVAIVGIC